MRRFFVVFLLAILLLFSLELVNPVQRFAVVPWTEFLAHLCAWLIQLFDKNVIGVGKAIVESSTGRGVSIEAGCNGVEACLILVAAMLAYPAAWRRRLSGMLLGGLAVQSVNVLRVITLFYLAIWNEALFEFAHLYLWQALIMVDVLVVWLLWIRWVARREARRPEGHSA